MPPQFLTVSTLIRVMLRPVEGADAPRIYRGAAAPGNGLRGEILASCRQNDLMVRFLAEIDSKLDAVLALLQRESLASEFPHEGYVVELGGDCAVLECAHPLLAGSHIELLLLVDEFPMRIVSVLARVEGQNRIKAGTSPDSVAYALRFVLVDEEDREAVIRLVFSEDRKRIRQQRSF